MAWFLSVGTIALAPAPLHMLQHEVAAHEANYYRPRRGQARGEAMYTEHVGLNCYANYGGVPVDPADPETPHFHDICKNTCDTTPGCTAFVVYAAHEKGCWLRSKVDIGNCQSWDKYNTWVKQGPPPDPHKYIPHIGRNCYIGSGGVPTDSSDPEYDHLSTDQCRSKCTNSPGCTAFTVYAPDPTKGCWLRSSITIDSCAYDHTYDTWALPPPPSKTYPVGWSCTDSPPSPGPATDWYMGSNGLEMPNCGQGCFSSLGTQFCDANQDSGFFSTCAYIEDASEAIRSTLEGNNEYTRQSCTGLDQDEWMGTGPGSRTNVAWTMHQNTNCYTSHGGTPMQPNDNPYKDLSLDKCKEKCSANPSCSAVVVMQGNSEAGCYLRASIDLDECGNGNYDTYSLETPDGGTDRWTLQDYWSHVHDTTQYAEVNQPAPLANMPCLCGDVALTPCVCQRSRVAGDLYIRLQQLWELRQHSAVCNLQYGGIS